MCCRLQNVVGTAQLSVLTLQPFQLTQLLGRRTRPDTPIRLGPPNPQTYRLGFRPQLFSDRTDRLPLRGVLVLVIEDHPHRTLTHLFGILPTMLFLILHSSILSKSGASTKPGAIHPERNRYATTSSNIVVTRLIPAIETFEPYSTRQLTSLSAVYPDVVVEADIKALVESPAAEQAHLAAALDARLQRGNVAVRGDTARLPGQQRLTQ